MRLHYRLNGEPKDFRVPLETTRPNYGGRRWWFRCPANGRRVAKLHSPPGGDIFASRRAYGLAYRNQRADERALTRSEDIRMTRIPSQAQCITDHALRPRGPGARFDGWNWSTVGRSED